MNTIFNNNKALLRAEMHELGDVMGNAGDVHDGNRRSRVFIIVSLLSEAAGEKVRCWQRDPVIIL